ncbi:MAG: M16 family metallopeptidase [Alphaproteobacteria bacterium]
MSRNRLLVFAAVAATALVASARGPAWAAKPYAEQVVERTLDNGLKILMLPDHKAPVTVVQVWYRVGSRNETPGVTGLSHMLEHMMFKGTKSHGPEEYSKIISRNGGNENAFTSDDMTTYFATLASDRAAVEIELEADRMRGIQLTKENFEPERQVVMEERRMRVDDNPIAFLIETLGAATFLEHPYRQPTIGWAKDIEGWTLEDLQHHYDVYYRPNNAVVVVVGDFDPAAMGDLVAQKFGPIPRGEDPPKVRATEPAPRGEKRIQVEKPAKLPFVAIQWHAPNLHHADSPALEMLAGVLSNGKTSRLYRDLVHRDRLALEADASYDRTSIDDKTFAVGGQPQPGVPIEKLEAALLAQVEAIRKAPPTQEELDRARAQMEAAFVFAQDSMFYRGMLLGTYEMAGGWRQIDDYLPSLAKVTPADVQRVAQEWLTPANRTTGVLVPLPIDPSAPIERMPSGPIH